jgi:hypothetical protein
MADGSFAALTLRQMAHSLRPLYGNRFSPYATERPEGASHTP